ncbi:hypothetical protein ACFOYU_18675 [Microvirga sp. GCM10011540]|uniref:hypothetical protein n=1 Tax=Microvirga sp. GCM10011540 TaxID=3317338 RepID=UPI00361B585E
MIVSYTDYGRDYLTSNAHFVSGGGNALFFLHPDQPLAQDSGYYQQIRISYGSSEYFLDYYFAFDGQGQKLIDSFDVFDATYNKIASVVASFVPATAGALDYKDDQFYLSGASDEWYDGGGTDYLDLSDGNDVFHFASGQDKILGGSGFDRVEARQLVEVEIEPVGDEWYQLKDTSGALVLSAKYVERIQLADKTLSLYPDGWHEERDGHDIFRFYNTSTSSHFYTSLVTEKDELLVQHPNFIFEGNAFDTSATALNGIDVFRFYNQNTNTHFYTTSVPERDHLITTYSHFKFEGTVYYAHAEDGGGQYDPLYRFYNTDTGTHFYTVNEAERDNVILTLPQYKYEGIAYYVDLM